MKDQGFVGTRRSKIASRSGLVMVMAALAGGGILFLLTRFVAELYQMPAFYPLNGAFQLYNPIVRIFDGEIPGRDFPAYLGLGATYFMALVSALLGGGFPATFAANHALHAVFFMAEVAFILHLAGLRRIDAFLLWTGVTLMMLAALAQFHLVEISEWASVLFYPAIPGNSEMGLRAAGLFAGGFMIWMVWDRPRQVGPISRSAWRRVWCGLVAGALVIWSLDYGVAGALALGLLAILIPDKTGLLRRLFLWLGFFLPSAILTFLILGLAATGFALESWIDQTLGVAGDQYWYFFAGAGGGGVYDRNIAKILEDPATLGAALILPALFLGYFLSFRANANRHSAVLSYLLVGLALAAVLRLWGGQYIAYFFRPLTIVVWVLFLACAVRLLASVARSRYRIKAWRWGTWTAYAIVLLMLGWAALFAQNWMDRASQRHRDLRAQAIEMTGFGLQPPSYRTAAILAERIKAETASLPPEQRLFSTYVSAMDHIVGARQATGIDYNIHALGAASRQGYLTRFRQSQPRYVTTIRQDFTPWSLWNWQRNWWFHRDLLAHYRPSDVTGYNILWAPMHTAQPQPIPVDCRIESNDGLSAELALSLPAFLSTPQQGAYMVDLMLHYDAQPARDGWLDWLISPNPLVTYRVLPPHGVAAGAPAPALPPGEKTWPLLLWWPEDAPAVAKIRIRIRPEGAALMIHGCQAQILARETDLGLQRLADIQPRDGEGWVRGLLPSASGTRLTLADAHSVQDILAGGKIAFADAGWRTITSVNGPVIEVAGPALDPDKDGYPHPVRLLLK